MPQDPGSLLENPRSQESGVRKARGAEASWMLRLELSPAGKLLDGFQAVSEPQPHVALSL